MPTVMGPAARKPVRPGAEVSPWAAGLVTWHLLSGSATQNGWRRQGAGETCGAIAHPMKRMIGMKPANVATTPSVSAAPANREPSGPGGALTGDESDCRHRPPEAYRQ